MPFDAVNIEPTADDNTRTPYPTDGALYTWNQDALEWDEVQVSLTDGEDGGA
jgi:hypothetical protein